MEPRPPVIRIVGASLLGLAILGLTVVLFDPDLGTDAPLFGEFTCRGKIDISVANGFGQPFLRPPSSAVFYNATVDGHPIAVYLTLFVRESGEPWAERLSRRDDPSVGYIFIPEVTEHTEAEVLVKDITGKACAARSPTLRSENATSAA